jgi:excinuclease UvrABC helicase subunit UvrB
MDGETNGGQEATQGAQDASQQQGQEQQETQQQGQSQVDNTPDYEKQIAERDEKIASLEAQVAEAAKNAETAEQLRGEIVALTAAGTCPCPR